MSTEKPEIEVISKFCGNFGKFWEESYEKLGEYSKGNQEKSEENLKKIAEENLKFSLPLIPVRYPLNKPSLSIVRI